MTTDINKPWLYGKTLAELKEVATSLGLPGFTAKQIADWLYKKNATNIDQFTNLSIKAREVLKAEYQVGYIAHTMYKHQ